MTKKPKYNFLDPDQSPPIEEFKDDYDFTVVEDRLHYMKTLRSYVRSSKIENGDVRSVSKIDAFGAGEDDPACHHIIIRSTDYEGFDTKLVVISFDYERNTPKVHFSYLCAPSMVAYLAMIITSIHPIILKENCFQNSDKIYFGESARYHFAESMAKEYLDANTEELTIPEGEIKH